MPRSGRLVAVGVGVVAAIAAGSPAAISASASATGPQAGTAQNGQTRLVNDCLKGRVRPRKVIITCADANFRLRGIRWSSWRRGEARGRGTAVINDCEPNCAEGTFHTYPIRLRAFDRRRGACVPGFLFARLAWRFPSERPDGMKAKGRARMVCPSG